MGRLRSRSLLICAFALLTLLWAPGVARAALDLPAGFSEITVAKRLADPTALAYAPDGRMFVAEKSGRVRVVRADGSLAAAPVIDIRDHVATAGDRGLLGIAVDAAFATNRFVYLLYTYDERPALDPAAAKTSRLTRIEVGLDNTVRRRRRRSCSGRPGPAPCPAPANTSDCIPSSSDSHAIGTVRADPDGTLWVGSGDGAEYAYMDRSALRTLRRAVAVRQAPARRPRRPRPARAPLLPAGDRSHEGLHEALREGLPQSVPLPAAPRLGPGRRRRRLGHQRGARLRRARPQLRLAVLRGHEPHARLPGASAVPGAVRERPALADAAGLPLRAALRRRGRDRGRPALHRDPLPGRAGAAPGSSATTRRAGSRPTTTSAASPPK